MTLKEIYKKELEKQDHTPFKKLFKERVFYHEDDKIRNRLSLGIKSDYCYSKETYLCLYIYDRIKKEMIEEFFITEKKDFSLMLKIYNKLKKEIKLKYNIN